MTTETQIAPLVEAAVRREWEQFAADHPRLAAVLAEPAVLAGVQQALRDDRAFRQAMEDAVMLRAGLQTLGQLVGDAVKRWFDKLL